MGSCGDALGQFAVGPAHVALTPSVLVAAEQGAARMTLFDRYAGAPLRLVAPPFNGAIDGLAASTVGDRHVLLVSATSGAFGPRVLALATAGLTDEGVANDSASDESAIDTGRHVPLCRALA